MACSNVNGKLRSSFGFYNALTVVAYDASCKYSFANENNYTDGAKHPRQIACNKKDFFFPGSEYK